MIIEGKRFHSLVLKDKLAIECTVLSKYTKIYLVQIGLMIRDN